jgi:hypothetical protein
MVPPKKYSLYNITILKCKKIFAVDPYHERLTRN